jgi:hypothetical protein
VHGDASDYVASRPVGIAACIGATWIGGGVAGTVALLRRSLAPGGIMLIGEPYWRRDPPDQATVDACQGAMKEDWLGLPELTAGPARYVQHRREYVGWGVFALMDR